MTVGASAEGADVAPDRAGGGADEGVSARSRDALHAPGVLSETGSESRSPPRRVTIVALLRCSEVEVPGMPERPTVVEHAPYQTQKPRGFPRNERKSRPAVRSFTARGDPPLLLDGTSATHGAELYNKSSASMRQ
jgi:hypothetical protein